LKEAEKLATAESRGPPRDLLTLKLLIATYLALLWSLYSDTCELYGELFAIYDILEEPEVMAMKHAFTPILCKQITWAIYDDSRSFFATRMHPDDFKPNSGHNRRARWPRSLLDNIMCDVRYQRPIHRTNFPHIWREQMPPFAGAQPPPTFPSPFAHGGQRFGGTPQPVKQLQSPGGNNGSDKLAHIHPKIKAALQEYHSKFLGRVMIYRVLEAAEITMLDLPKINQLINTTTGRNYLCYSHLLGICPHGEKCLFKANSGHMDAHEVTDEFAEALLRKIQQGIQWDATPARLRSERRSRGKMLRAGGGRGGGGGRGRGGHKRKTPGG
jgi:hypothetical protein